MNNVVSKILIVANLVFSLCFMCFAGAVYSFQAGWRGKATAAVEQLTSVKLQLETSQKEKDDLKTTLGSDLKKQSDRADAAEGLVEGLKQNLQQAVSNQANAEKERDKHLADLALAQKETDARITETNDARAEIKRLRDQNNDAITVRRDLEDKNLQMEGELADAGSREAQFLKEITRLNDLCRLNKIDPRDPVIGPIPKYVEKVDGVVEGALKNASNSAEHVQISVGKDDGVFKKMRMTAYRGSKFLATIEITEVYPDKAVGRVIEETRNGTIERGDHVTTKF